jgi:hypothetical protein
VLHWLYLYADMSGRKSTACCLQGIPTMLRPLYRQADDIQISTLSDVSKSITMYLHDEQSKYRILAIDLCSRGFQVWQNYVDAVDILRALFTFATNASKHAITAQNVGAQARLAVLQIVSSSTPLFMTTLGLDILHPRTVDYRKSVLQIVAFLIRKVRVCHSSPRSGILNRSSAHWCSYPIYRD